MGETFAELARGGPLPLAVGAAALAGLVAFLSPCVLPLVPGYLSYVTGLAGADLDAPRRRGRVLAGVTLFVLGFTVVFTLVITLVANVALTMQTHKRVLDVVLGVLVVLLGLAYLGLVPGLDREVRVRRLPAAGLLGAPVFGALFAVSWTPCVGPTLGAVGSLATAAGGASRAVVLALAYSAGLGLPFVVFGLFFRRMLGVSRAVRRHSRWVTRTGGVLLVVIGVSLLTGGWNAFLIWLLTSFDFGAGTPL